MFGHTAGIKDTIRTNFKVFKVFVSNQTASQTSSHVQLTCRYPICMPQKCIEKAQILLITHVATHLKIGGKTNALSRQHPSELASTRRSQCIRMRTTATTPIPILNLVRWPKKVMNEYRSSNSKVPRPEREKEQAENMGMKTCKRADTRCTCLDHKSRFAHPFTLATATARTVF